MYRSFFFSLVSSVLLALVLGVGFVLAQDSAPVSSDQATASLLTEDFNYPVGDAITAHGWTAHSGTTNPIAVTSPGLSYAGYSAGVGNAVTLTTTGEDDNKPLSSAVTSGTVYAAALVNVTASQTTGDYFFHLFVSSSIFYGRLYVKKDSASNNFSFGISKSNNAPVYTNPIYAPNTTYLVIVKYTFNAGSGTDDTVDLFINPTLGGAEPAPALSDAGTATADSTGFVAVALRQGSATAAPNVMVDQIRVGTTWADVAGGAATPKHVDSDFTGDGKTDFAVFRPDSQTISAHLLWYILPNSYPNASDPTNFIFSQWGLATDTVLIGKDFDGDSKSDITVWRPQTGSSGFYILRSSDNTVSFVRFGDPGDDPSVTNDYTGDGKADPAVFRAGATSGAQSYFFYRASSGPFNNGGDVFIPWGTAGDSAYPGDFDGDGKADFAVYRNNGGGHALFYILFGTDSPTMGNTTATYFGLTTDDFVPGDYDGDGKTDIASTRVVGSQMVWNIHPSSGGADYSQQWGLGSDLEVQGDYDGDGKTDIGVFRNSATPGQTAFYILSSSTGSAIYQVWGNGSDTPVQWDIH